FNLLFSLLSSGRSLSESDLNFRSNLTSVRALHNLQANELAFVASVIKRPHLSAVCLLKNFAINFVHRVAALSAAEKRDYAELFRRCQQLAEEIFSFNSPPTSSRHPAGQELSTTRKPAPLLPLHRLTRPAVAFVSALRRAARGEY
ncbi:hypothetical protein, partial [Ralstonia mannitolilytica]|uniref:hypothetical protein n=1 Tax=Ralstonia mannitolilytica TaxID=105219 RepID=UPI00292FD2E6